MKIDYQFITLLGSILVGIYYLSREIRDVRKEVQDVRKEVQDVRKEVQDVRKEVQENRRDIQMIKAELTIIKFILKPEEKLKWLNHVETEEPKEE